MCRMILWGISMILSIFCQAQKKWDGGGNNNQWYNDQNWFPDGIPTPLDDVILDNSLFPTAYVVEFPSGNITVEIRSLLINADSLPITVLLPVTNTASPGLTVTAPLDPVILGKAAIFRNASGASSGNTILLTGNLKILDGGRYIHQTPRGNAALIDKLSTSPGTEKGIFEFDVPGLAGYTVSLTSNVFGSLKFSQISAGGNKSYSGSGTGNLIIRGDLIIDSAVQVSSTLTADILLGGNLVLKGRLNLIPVTAGSTGRSLKFSGKNVVFTGEGELTMNTNFRQFEIIAGSSLTLERNCILSNLSNAFINYGILNAGSFTVSGNGKFAQADLAGLIIGSPSGIQTTGDSGNIQTVSREFSKKSGYIFQGLGPQRTGNGLPDSVYLLSINNPFGVLLTQQVFCSDSLLLLDGKMVTDTKNILVSGGKIIRSPGNNYGIVNGGWENSFVSGPMITETSDTGYINIPVGAENIFAPLRIRKIVPGLSRFYSEYHPNPPPDTSCNSSLLSISQKEYWTVNVSDMGTIEISYRPESFLNNEGFTVTPAVYSLYETDSSWMRIGGNKTGINEYGMVTTDTIVTGFTKITMGFAIPDQPLSWRLKSFSALIQQNGVKLKWSLDEDNEPVNYLLEKSDDGRSFKEFYSMSSPGKTSVLYEMVDEKPFTGTTFYRLKIMSGTRNEYSGILPVKWLSDKVLLYPNPTNDLIYINFPAISSRCELVIVNIHGLIVLRTFVSTVTCQIRVNNLRNGMYHVMLRHNNRLITLPFTKY